MSIISEEMITMPVANVREKMSISIQELKYLIFGYLI